MAVFRRKCGSATNCHTFFRFCHTLLPFAGRFMAHGHTWGLLPACSPKGEEHIRKLLCRNRLRGLSWKGTSQSRLFATASKQPACPQSGHEPRYASAWRGYESICHVASILLVRPCNVPVYLSSTDPSVPDRVRQFANLSLTGSSLSLYSNKVFTRFLGRF